MKKGFTLVELLAVIILIGITCLIVFPEVNDAMNRSKQKAYETQIKNLINSTKEMVIKDTSILPDINSSNIVCVSPTQLKEAGKIESDIINDPRKSGDFINGYILISYSTDYNQYIYEYSETCPN